MAILVTGGASYIGSVTVERLTANGESIVVLDDLAYGHLESIDAEPFRKNRSSAERRLQESITQGM
jgi:UDP-glucose 4-epimerase